MKGNKSIRVLTILSRLDMGGIEKTLLGCVPFLKERNVILSILCNKGGRLDENFEELGVEIIDFQNNNKPGKDTAFFRQVLNKHKFDIIHSRLGHTSGRLAKVASAMGIPFIVSIHNERPMFRNNWIDKPILGWLRFQYLEYQKKLTLKFATKIVGHSKANLRYFTNENHSESVGDKFTVIYNGVDFDKLNNYKALNEGKASVLDKFRKNHDIIMIHIGSFKEQKNHSFLIKVFKSLRELNINIGLILIGDGGLKRIIEESVQELKIGENVLFTGLETNIAPYLYSSDIFAFPSLYEGFGNVLIEAQYSKLPIWPSDIAPHHEAAFDKYATFMFDPKDLNSGLEKIKDLIVAIEGEDFGGTKDAAFKFAADFSIEKMSENLFNLYEGVIESLQNK